MANSLEDRLKEHANAFDGLLSLIPAKYYYDEDTSNQWKAKRQSKQERRQSKRMKLDPEQAEAATAKQVLEAREKEAQPVVIPGKAPSTENDAPTEVFDDNGEAKNDTESQQLRTIWKQEAIKRAEKMAEEQEERSKKLAEKKVENKAEKKSEASKRKRRKSMSEQEQQERKKHLSDLRAKLTAKINTLRTKRKAVGSNVPGAATSRTQMLEERKRRRDARKKELEEKRKQEQENKDSSSDEDEADEEEANGADTFYGNIQFADGEKVTTDFSGVRRGKGKKGPANKDIKAHLKKLEREKEKLKTMEPEKRATLERKKQWNRAMASAEGVKVKDDERLLKKALGRKDAKKRKTKKEWRERVSNVKEQIHAKDVRRRENLWIRKENKGRSRKDQIKQLPSHKKLSRTAIKQSRAGFEGRVKRRRKK